MVPPTDRPSRHVAWCLGGFLFPAAIWAIGLAFQREHPPSPAELERAWVHPDVLSYAVGGLMLGHVVAGGVALVRWPHRGWVWAATAAQLACSLCASFLAAMAVQGT